MGDNPNNNSRRLRKRTIEAHQRRVVMSAVILANPRITDAELSVRFGKSTPTVAKDRAFIEKGWREYTEVTHPEALAEALERGKFLWGQAQDDYERSRTKTVECETCKGKGIDGDEQWCEDCDGNGKLTIKVKGDQQCLATAHKAWMELNKLLGLHVERAEVNVRGKVSHVHFDAGEFSDASPDDLMALKVILDRMRSGGAIIEGEVLEGKNK